MTSPSPFDPDYVKKAAIFKAQKDAEASNAVHVQSFKQAAADWLVNAGRARDLSLPIPPAPVPPKKIVISDGGESSLADFPDLSTPVLPPANQVPSSGSIANPNPPPDRTDQIIAMLRAIGEKLGV